jgi:hypothetical protein
MPFTHGVQSHHVYQSTRNLFSNFRSLTMKISSTFLPLICGLSLALSLPARAHEEGAPFSAAIIDPLLLHHAHIENEQRINFFGLRQVETESGRKSSAFEAELEIGYATRDFRYGWELFVPILNIPDPEGSGRETGIGDIELRPIKYSIFQRPAFIVTTASAIRLPTGSTSAGLGEGNTVLTQHLFADAAAGNWFLGVNLAAGTNVGGETGSSFEYGAVLSYSFIRETRGFEVAKMPRSQKWVVSPSIEFVDERAFRGPESGAHSASLAPGLTFWHQPSGWQIHAGVSLPVSGGREAEQIFLLQFGNHRNWGRLFGRQR